MSIRHKGKISGIAVVVILFLLFCLRFETRVLPVLLKIVVPEKLAIQMSKLGYGRIIYLATWSGRGGGTSETYGIVCYSVNSKVFPVTIWSDPEYKSDASTIARYNRMIVSMPEFPAPHICHLDDQSEKYFKNQEFLSDLNITKDEYRTRRLQVERSTIYTASYFGHLDVISGHLDEVKRCDGEYYPIYYAKKAKQKDVMDFLIKNGARENKSDCKPPPWPVTF